LARNPRAAGARRAGHASLCAEPHRGHADPAGHPETLVDVDGIAETWFDDRDTMARANASPEAKRLHDDGASFIGRIKSFIVEEKFIIGSY
jgi:hypothetical protein